MNSILHIIKIILAVALAGAAISAGRIYLENKRRESKHCVYVAIALRPIKIRKGSDNEPDIPFF